MGEIKQRKENIALKENKNTQKSKTYFKCKIFFDNRTSPPRSQHGTRNTSPVDRSQLAADLTAQLAADRSQLAVTSGGGSNTWSRSSRGHPTR